MTNATDPRWVYLLPDGSHGTLGRHTAPTEPEIAALVAALARAGTGGWLAIMSHSVHGRRVPTLEMVAPLGDPWGTFADAVMACRQAATMRAV